MSESDRWRELVERELRYRGYTDEQIRESNTDPDHSRCGRNEFGWECFDEDERPLHPLHDEANDIAEVIGRAFGWI